MYFYIYLVPPHFKNVTLFLGRSYMISKFLRGKMSLGNIFH